jgi:hypothetical protein
MQRATATPGVIVYVVQALVVIFLLTGIHARGRLGGLGRLFGRGGAEPAAEVVDAPVPVEAGSER